LWRAWEAARHNNEFDIFARPFGHLLSLVRERASALAGNGDLYDALLGEFEHGMTRSRLEPVLDEVKSRLVPLVKAASAKSSGAAALLEGRRFPEKGQWELCRRVLAGIGFEFDRGRLDKSTHPFTLYAGGNDVRLTTRFIEDDPTDAVLATLHEGGHGLYDQGFDAGDHGTLLAEAPSMGLHESQSRLWENHVGRSLGFWRHAFPWVRSLFPKESAGLSPESFHRAVNLVRPGVNRVSADELSYHLHIALRYELETALLSGQVTVRDLPGIWNERSAALIGARPSSDREGVLQDVHWSLGMIGYFPTYTLGSLYAAQLAETYAKKHPLAEEIAHGEFDGLRNWLRAEVHRVGHRYGAEEIVQRATGKGLDAAAFFRHVETSQKALGN
jgi:carboxypeptidase Taq